MLVVVLMGVLDGMRWDGHHQAAVLNAFETDEAVGELRNAR